MLHFASAVQRQFAPHHRIVRAHEIDGARIAKPRGHVCRADHVGEHHDAARWLADRRFTSERRRGIGDAAEESFDYDRIDLNDLGGQQAVRVGMRALEGCGVRRFDQAERSAGARIEPIGEKAHAVLVLHLQVLSVSVGDLLSRDIRQPVSVHVDRHSNALHGVPLCPQSHVAP